MKNGYNIEFAHIYADKNFRKEQKESLEISKKVLERLKRGNKSFTLSLLMDDLHAKKKSLNEKELIKKLSIKPDFIAYESRFSDVAKKLIKEIPGNKKNVLENGNLVYNNRIGLTKNGNYTCALLAASWYLCRLGNYKLPQRSVKKFSNKKFKAEKIITILPKKYKPVEKKVIEIIKATKFKEKIKDIDYVWF